MIAGVLIFAAFDRHGVRGGSLDVQTYFWLTCTTIENKEKWIYGHVGIKDGSFEG